MKKINLLKLISLLLIAVLLMSVAVVTSFASAEEENVEICKKNIVFGEKIQLMFALKAPDDVEVTASCGNQAVGIEYLENQTIDGVEYRIYQTTDGWAAQNINAVVTVTATAGEKTDVLSYSVLMYLYERLNLDNLDPVEDADRIAMYEALLEYAKAADKVINNQDGRTPNDLDSYYYVSVVNGTLDGYNTWGMFKAGDTPFANIAHTLDLGEGETVEWTYAVNGSNKGKIEPDALKSLSVEGTLTVTASVAIGYPNHDCNCIDGICQPISSESELKAAMSTAGSYYLTNDLDLTSAITVSEDVNICLNGKVIKAAAEKNIFNISKPEGESEGYTLTVTDCTQNERKGYIDPTTNLWVESNEPYSGEGTAIDVTLKGGLLMGGESGHGGAIYAKESTVNISNVNIVNNTANTQGGAMYIHTSDVTLQNVAFVANNCTYVQAEGAELDTNAGRGGAIYCTSANDPEGTQLKTDECRFIGNTSSGDGSAIYVTSSGIYIDGTQNGDNGSDFIANTSESSGAICSYGSVSLYGSTFENNSSLKGGAIYAGGALIAEGASFTENSSASGHGGAIYVASSSVNTKSCTFVGNSAGSTNFGGAVYVSDTGTYTDGVNSDYAQASTFDSNTAKSGGAILSEGTTDLYGSILKNNTAGAGGAIYVTGGVLNAYGAQFTNNASTGGQAGALYVSATVNTYSCTFTQNATASEKNGGAIYVNGSGYYTDGVENDTTQGSTFDSNTAANYGGAIGSNGTVKLYGSTFKGNQALFGGALYVAQDDGKTHTVTVYGCNFTQNEATGGSSIGGGAIAAAKSIPVTIVGGSFTENVSAYYGGAISATATSSITISGGTEISANEGKTGSALYFKTTGKVTVSDIAVNDNKNGTNGVIYIGNGTEDNRHTFTNVTASGNSANKGGVFYISGGFVTIDGSTLTGNTASGDDAWGGAIYISKSNALIINSSTISGNEAKYGGGIYAKNASIIYELNETQVTGNTATAEDGSDEIYPVA